MGIRPGEGPKIKIRKRREDGDYEEEGRMKIMRRKEGYENE